ncbi:uncharacterized protein LOC141912209 [Tubulanus polymorphus]|uniref:uncharacterized protein LOC141912209 n=1 Tax=Tubulanus polymorphus TaxID=672921 RepID=UPI003DA504B0
MKLICLMVLFVAVCGTLAARNKYRKRDMYHGDDDDDGECQISHQKNRVLRASERLGGKVVGKFLEVLSCEDGDKIENLAATLESFFYDYEFGKKLCKVFTTLLKHQMISIDHVIEHLKSGIKELNNTYQTMLSAESGHTGHHDDSTYHGSHGGSYGSPSYGGSDDYGDDSTYHGSHGGSYESHGYGGTSDYGINSPYHGSHGGSYESHGYGGTSDYGINSPYHGSHGGSYGSHGYEGTGDYGINSTYYAS